MTTRSDTALSLVCCLLLKAEINKRKLILFRHFRLLNGSFHIKYLFLMLLTFSLFNASGSLADVLNAMSWYVLDKRFTQYVTCVEFSSRIQWKKTYPIIYGPVLPITDLPLYVRRNLIALEAYIACKTHVTYGISLEKGISASFYCCQVHILYSNHNRPM